MPETRDIELLMSSALCKWGGCVESDTNAYYSALTNLEKVAVIFGQLHYQVGNGGFLRWIHAQRGNILIIHALRTIILCHSETDIPIANALLTILKHLEPRVREWRRGKGAFRSERRQRVYGDLDTLNSMYYSLGERVFTYYQQVLSAYDVKQDPFLAR